MEFCSYKHEEIVFNSKSCPLCDIINEKKDLENELEYFKKELEILESTVQDLKEENDAINKSNI